MPRKAQRHTLLFFDLETAPCRAWVWGPKVEYINHQMMERDSFILSWAAKWEPGDRTMAGWLTPAEVRKGNDKRIVRDLARLVGEADILVAHNGDKFDIPVLNGRLLMHELPPMGVCRKIDTLKLSRKFKLPYHKLDWLGEKLIHENKLKTDFQLWLDVMDGDEKAMRRMVRYNRKDVRLLQKVFDKLRPYVKLPRLVDAAEEGEMICPDCGGRLMKRGIHRTNTYNYQRYSCLACGSFCGGRKSTKVPKLGVKPI